jgi:RNA polymerase sigma-70 factor, ECF subfamily
VRNGSRAYLAFASAAPVRTILERTVNGRPGLVAQLDGVTITVSAFEIEGERIKHIWAMRNPDKLHPWTMG